MNENHEWLVVVVEDDPNLRAQIREFLEGEKFSVGRLRIVDIENFDDALGLLRDRKVDLVILDVYRGAPTEHDAAGIQLLKDWRAAGFAPVILHTALPETVKDSTSPFVRLVSKEAGSLERLRAEIDDLFTLKVPQIARAVRQYVDNVVRDYMWTFVEGQWEGMKPLLQRVDFMRLLVRRLAADLSRAGIGDILESVYEPISADASDVVHPTAYYVKPPVGIDIQMGDLRLYGGVLVFVLWPSCDLVERKGECKVTHALCAVLQPLSATSEFKNWKAHPSKSNQEVLCDLMSNKRRKVQAERYHFLPAAWDIPDSLVDFQELTHVTVKELKDAACVATVASPFAESVANRFMRYISRLGTPDLSLDVVLEALK